MLPTNVGRKLIIQAYFIGPTRRLGPTERRPVLQSAMPARLLLIAALLAAFAIGFAELVRKTDTIGEAPPAVPQQVP